MPEHVESSPTSKKRKCALADVRRADSRHNVTKNNHDYQMPPATEIEATEDEEHHVEEHLDRDGPDRAIERVSPLESPVRGKQQLQPKVVKVDVGIGKIGSEVPQHDL